MSSLKKFTRQQIKEHATSEKVVFIIHNEVYDVTNFIDEHPGGHEVLINNKGADASEDFDDIGHSLDAKEMMIKYRIGELVDEDKVEIKQRTVSWSTDTNDQESSVWSSWKMPILLGVLVTVIYSYLMG